MFTSLTASTPRTFARSFAVAGALFLTGFTALLPQAAQADAFSPSITHENVDAYTTDRYTVRLRGGEYAEIGVVGDGDTDLDLEILDADGDRAAIDDDSTDQCLTHFYVPRSGTYTIRVINLGRVYNAYTLLVR